MVATRTSRLFNGETTNGKITNGHITEDTIHFNAGASNTELLFRTIHSANQISIYGAVSSWCEEFGQRPDEKDPTSERFVAKENEQLLRNVTPKEGNSLGAKLQGVVFPHLETDCENVFRNL